MFFPQRELNRPHLKVGDHAKNTLFFTQAMTFSHSQQHENCFLTRTLNRKGGVCWMALWSCVCVCELVVMHLCMHMCHTAISVCSITPYIHPAWNTHKHRNTVVSCFVFMLSEQMRYRTIHTVPLAVYGAIIVDHTYCTYK